MLALVCACKIRTCLRGYRSLNAYGDVHVNACGCMCICINCVGVFEVVCELYSFVYNLYTFATPQNVDERVSICHEIHASLRANETCTFHSHANLRVFHDI